MKIKKTGAKSNLSLNFRINLIISLLIAVSLIAGVVVFSRVNLILSRQIKEQKEAARPAELEVTILSDANCQDCFNPQVLISALKREKIKIKTEKTLKAGSPEGEAVIKKFKINKIPTLIVSGEIDKNPKLKELWPKIGEIIDGNFVLRRVSAPYRDLLTNEIRGRVELVVLKDKSCAECYDPSTHEKILKRYGWPENFSREIMDIKDGDGRALIKKYKIGLVPTIILKGDLDVYPALKKIWSQVGTVEADGAYVFRQGVKQMGVYKNLAANQIVKPRLKTKLNK